MAYWFAFAVDMITFSKRVLYNDLFPLVLRCTIQVRHRDSYNSFPIDSKSSLSPEVHNL